MYASLGQLVRGWSRILYDALDRKTWRLAVRLLDPIVFCQSGHVVLLVAVLMLLARLSGPFAWWLLGLSLVHHVFMYSVFRPDLPDLGPRLALYSLVPPGQPDHRLHSSPIHPDVPDRQSHLAGDELQGQREPRRAACEG